MTDTLNQKHEAVLRKAAAAIRARGHEGDARLADSVEGIISSLARRASPAAAVPEGALPPEPWGDDFEAWLEVRTGHEVRTEIRAYARAAVEADRAQRPILQEQAATMLAQRKKIQRLEAALADRAQQGEPVGEVIYFAGDGDLKEVAWRKGKLPPVGTKLYAGPVIATKAAAPADAPRVMSYAEMAKWARDNGLNVPPEWERAPAEDAREEVPSLQAASLDSYAVEDRAFFSFWYGHMQGDVMTGALADVRHSTARYIWDAARRASSVPAIPGTGREKESPVHYTVGVNHCNCHPETCCCDAWAVFGRAGKKHSTHFVRSTAEQTADALNGVNVPSHPSEAKAGEPEIRDVREFGAVGDGVADDTAALQRAADWCAGRAKAGEDA